MRLRTGLLAALAYVLLLAILALGVPLALSLSTRVNDEVRSQAQGQADLVAATAADLLSSSQRGSLGDLVRTSAGAVRGRVLVVDASGRVVADSASPPELGANYSARPEIVSALRGRTVQVQRASRTLGQEILATAVPIIRNGAPVGAVRVTQSVAAVHAAVRRVELGLALIGVVVLALGLGVGVLIAAQIARPLGRLEQVAGRVAAGDLDARAKIEGSREQRSLGASFNEMTERVQRLLGSQAAFVADASHQLRTPLTGLRLRIEEARAAGVSSQAGLELDAASGEVDRLARIVEELLVLSRAGEREAPGSRVSLDDAVSRGLARWRSAAGKRAIELQAGALSGGEVWCSEADLDRAVDVLVENALCYAPADSRVEIACAAGRIEVTDEGPGLSEQDDEAILERFHRGSAGRAGPAGSGLGLAIARELMREWGGEVNLVNRPGAGALATIVLPLAGGPLPTLNRKSPTVKL
ncbi:MAG: sensor histidine kinase [Solirubrobacteraceae bacterium]